jgi:hypothetical protein
MSFFTCRLIQLPRKVLLSQGKKHVARSVGRDMEKHLLSKSCYRGHLEALSVTYYCKLYTLYKLCKYYYTISFKFQVSR